MRVIAGWKVLMSPQCEKACERCSLHSTDEMDATTNRVKFLVQPQETVTSKINNYLRSTQAQRWNHSKISSETLKLLPNAVVNHTSSLDLTSKRTVTLWLLAKHNKIPLKRIAHLKSFINWFRLNLATSYTYFLYCLFFTDRESYTNCPRTAIWKH